MPTPAMHQGDFSALLAAGSQYTIYDPATRVAAAGGRFQQMPFPGNKIPVSRFDKVGASILSFYPTTEKTPGDPADLSNYQDAATAEKADYWNFTTRVDQNIGDKQRFFVRYSAYDRHSTYNNYFDNPFVGTQFYFISKTAAFDHVATLSPTLVLNTRYSYNRFIRGSDQPLSAIAFDLASLEFSAQYLAQVPKDQIRFPRINLTGFISNGSTNENRSVNNHTVASTLTKSAGAHSLRGGFEFRVYQETDQFMSNQQTGQFMFGSIWNKGPLDNSAASTNSIGQSVAALLLGLPDSGSITRQSDYAELDS